MKGLLIFLVLTLVSLSAFAQRYECGEVGGVEEYAIYVGLDVKKACFFDNDSCINIPLKTVNIYETYPVQTEYVFEGETRVNGKIRISFYLEDLTASVREFIGTSNEQKMSANTKCLKDSRIDFDD